MCVLWLTHRRPNERSPRLKQRNKPINSPSNNPIFAIVGRTNGAGKSTFAKIFIPGIPYINGDEIKRLAKQDGQRIDTFGLRILIQDRVQSHIRALESFAMESNLVSNFSFEIVNDVAT